MTATAHTIPVRPKRTTIGWAGLALAGAIATASIVALASDDSPSASPDARLSTPTHVAVPMSPDAAERWLTPDGTDVRGMSPDAAERWLDSK